MGIKLEDDKRYKDGKGREVWIAGTTKPNGDWAWSVQGNWYERSTGRAIGYRPVANTEHLKRDERPWEHYVREPSGDDVVKEIAGDWR